jgi:hypothetical protein
LGLDFTKGGRSSGGIDFEKEIHKLVTEASAQGQETAMSVVNLNAQDFDKAIEEVAKMLGKKVDDLSEAIIKQIVPGDQFSSSSPKNYYLKIGAKRFGKSDFAAAKNAGISFDIQGRAVGDLARAEKILQNASFSIKSYKTDRDVHLGNTSAVKAVSAVTEYVASKGGEYLNAK